MRSSFTLAALAACLLPLVSAAPSAPNIYAYKYSPSNIVAVNGLDNMCLIAPKDPHTDIGVAEGSGTKTYCTTKGRFNNADQGRLPDDFFKPGEAFYKVSGTAGKNQIHQITGCINASHLSRLNPSDEGGQFDSSGQGNNGVPHDSFCILPGTNKRGFYVQLIEPAENRFCIRCCESNSDCNHTNDTKGCPVAIPGKYGPSCS